MIKILWRDGRSAPIVVCDVCGDMISDYAEGGVVFPDPPAGANNVHVEALHIHKGACHDKAEARFQDGRCGWDELGLHLYRLCANTGIDTGQFIEERERHKRLSENGL